MKKYLFSLAGLLFLVGSCIPTSAYAQVLPIRPVVGLINAIAAQNAANQDIAAKTTTTATYREQTFLMKRTPATLLIGEATDRIEQLESQLALCRTALLADSTGITCTTEHRTAIREALAYLSSARPNWELKAYRQELRFYVAEDGHRKTASK